MRPRLFVLVAQANAHAPPPTPRLPLARRTATWAASLWQHGFYVEGREEKRVTGLFQTEATEAAASLLEAFSCSRQGSPRAQRFNARSISAF